MLLYSILGLMSMAIGTISLIAIIRPQKRFWLPTRGRALAVWLAAWVMLGISADNMPTARVKSNSQGTTNTASVQPSPSPSDSQEVSSITFEELHGLFRPDGPLTELQKDAQWKIYDGQCVEWEGEVVYLDEGAFSGISVGFKHRPATLTYDVLVSAPSSAKETLLGFRKGENYKYQATLRDYPGIIIPMTADWGCD